MPKVSLVVCLYRERDFLARLLAEAKGLFDDLVVVHDGPETGTAELSTPASQTLAAVDYSTHGPGADLPPGYREPHESPPVGSVAALVHQHHGSARFFEGPRCLQQEPHWPFAWSRACHDWILRLDADEFPSPSLKEWLRDFRTAPEPADNIAGYTCIWPLWNGKKTVTQQWPGGRIFLIHRKRVRFFGMVEQVPVPDGKFVALPLRLCHEPRRKSYGMRNILWRKQGGLWRRVIAESLLRTPEALPSWRWEGRPWPILWERLRTRPVRAGLYFFVRGFISTLRDQWRFERTFMPAMAAATPLHHLMIALLLRRLRKMQSGGVTKA